MKNHPSFTVASLLFCASVLMPGCAIAESPRTGDRSVKVVRTKEVRHEKSKQSEKRSSKEAPKIGMSKREVRSIYGEPSSISSSPNGEVWNYGSRIRGRDFIPFYGAFAKHEVGYIAFNSAGRVKDYSWGSTRWHR